MSPETKDQKIKVVSYSGYRGEEIPRSLIIDGKKINVVEIIKTWIEEDLMTRKVRRAFYLKGSDGLKHTIYYNENSMEWFYKIKI